MKALVLAAALLLHITPTVVLVKKPDAVRQLLPGAQTFTARELHLSDADAHRLHEAVDWSPADGVLTFYTGRRDGAPVGTFLFVRVDSPHGPVEVAVAFGVDRTIRRVVVTKATVETRPWVQKALETGLVERYVGLQPGAAPATAAQVREVAGSMPGYMAEQIDKGVARALFAFGDLFEAG